MVRSFPDLHCAALARNVNLRAVLMGAIERVAEALMIREFSARFMPRHACVVDTALRP
jgi:hypothetical protein